MQDSNVKNYVSVVLYKYIVNRLCLFFFARGFFGDQHYYSVIYAIYIHLTGCVKKTSLRKKATRKMTKL